MVMSVNPSSGDLEFRSVAGTGGVGNVVGPASSTDNALVRFDGATGKLIQNSNAILDDTGLLNLAIALPVSSGGTGVNTITGIVAGNGTSALVGRTLIAPAAGITISNPNGATDNPTFALANDLGAIEAIGTMGIIVRSATDTWVTRTLLPPLAGITITNPSGVAANPTFALANDLAAVEGLATNGIAVRTAADTWATRSILAGTGITVTNGSGVGGDITINSTGTMPWTEVTATSGTALINNGYILNNAGLVSFALPTTVSPVGSMVIIVGKGAGGWRITQAASQVIHTPDGNTTVGVTGSLSSTNQYCCITLVCTVANNEWTVINGYGNFTLV